MSKVAPAKKVTVPPSTTGSNPDPAKGIKKFPKNPPKGDTSTTETVAPGQYTWRVRRKLDGGDTPWKSGGPAEIMEVVIRRLEVLESFEKSTVEIEKRINALDKNILAVAKEIMPLEVEQFMPRPPKEPTPPPPETIMPRPPGAPPKPVVKEPVVAKVEPKKVAEAPKKAAAAPAAAAPAGGAAVKPGVKRFPRAK